MPTHQYNELFDELCYREKILIPMHRTIQDESYPSISWATLEHMVKLMRTVPLQGF